MKTHRIGVRVSGELHALLAATGDVSATTRALAILGAATAGYDLGGLRDEAASLLAAPLESPLRAALRGLLTERSTAVPQMLDTRSTAVEPFLNTSAAPAPPDLLLDDPLASVGMEV